MRPLRNYTLSHFPASALRLRSRPVLCTPRDQADNDLDIILTL